MKTIIVGARADGHAKVVLEILLAMKQFDIAGFIDDDESKIGETIRGYEVIGTMQQLPELMKKLAISKGIVAIGHNAMRRKLTQKLIHSGIEVINAIHPTAHFDSDVQIGYGCYIAQGVIVVTGTKIGNSVNIHTAASIDHDNIIEDGANIAPGVHTAGRVTICKDAFLGTGTIVIPDIVIGEAAITGAGSVVVKNVDFYTQVIGIPAKKVKNLR